VGREANSSYGQVPRSNALPPSTYSLAAISRFGDGRERGFEGKIDLSIGGFRDTTGLGLRRVVENWFASMERACLARMGSYSMGISGQTCPHIAPMIADIRLHYPKSIATLKSLRAFPLSDEVA